MRNFWWTAVRLAWRDLRFSRRRSLAAILAMAAGVAGMTAVRSVAARMRNTLSGDARQWIGADVAVSLQGALSPGEQQFIDNLTHQGVVETTVIDTYAMISADSLDGSVPAALKIVDPALYPLYGSLRLRPSIGLSAALQPGSIAVSPDLLDRMQRHIGDTIRIHRADLRIAAVIDSEPDRFAGFPGPLLRVLLSPETFESTGVARLGTALRQHLRFRAPPHIDATHLRDQLDSVFSYAGVTSYRDPDPASSEALDATVAFLQLTAWIALVLGAVGIAATAQLHLHQRVDSVAAMKCLGATRRQLLSIFGLQVTGLALLGSLLGILGGALVEKGLGALAVRVFSLHWLPAPGPSPFEAPLLAVGAALLLSLGTLRKAARTRPSLLLRRPVSPPTDSRSMLALLSPPAALAAIAIWLTRSATITGTFLTALLAIFAVTAMLWRFATALLSRLLAPRWPHSNEVRYGLLNLVRAPARSQPMAFALAIGILLLTASWIGQTRIAREVTRSLPLPGSSFYIIGLDPRELEPAQEFLNRLPGVLPPVGLAPLAWLRLSSVNNAAPPPDTPRMWYATCQDMPPSSGPPALVISETAARRLHAARDSILEFQVRGATLQARVAAIRPLDRLMDTAYALTFPCDAFTSLPVFYHAGVRVEPGRSHVVLAALAARFPAVPVVSREEFTSSLEAVANRAVAMLRLLAALVIAAGTLLLALLTSAAITTRAREPALWRAIGASRTLLRRSLWTEFAALGALAGAIGASLGCGFAGVLLSAVLGRAVLVFDPWAILAGTLFATVLSVSASWAASRNLWRRPPLEHLRDRE